MRLTQLTVRVALVAMFLVMIFTLGWSTNSSASPAPSSVLATRCQFDGNIMAWTGKTTVVNGRIYYVMRCIQGHEALAESPN